MFTGASGHYSRALDGRWKRPGRAGVGSLWRGDLGNMLVRIILHLSHAARLGASGHYSYDVNDYKSKAELTAQKLFTAVTTALRSYRDLRAINRSRQGWRKSSTPRPSCFGPPAWSLSRAEF